jgi:hypothetical protein
MFRPPFITMALAMALATAALAPAQAQVITFETDPSGAPAVDNASLGLASAYAVGGLGLTFGFDSDGNGTPDTPAVFEAIGNDGVDGFAACVDRDMASPGFETQLGNFFLRGTPGADFRLLVIDYAGGTVAAASGEIWDIDASLPLNEQYRVAAYDALGNLLGTIDSPVGTQDSGCLNTELDGRPWTFSFSGLTPGIARITIDFIGTKTQGIGLAFNNFNATGEGAVPESATSWGGLKASYR